MTQAFESLEMKAQKADAEFEAFRLALAKGMKIMRRRGQDPLGIEIKHDPDPEHHDYGRYGGEDPRHKSSGDLFREIASDLRNGLYGKDAQEWYKETLEEFTAEQVSAAFMFAEEMMQDLCDSMGDDGESETGARSMAGGATENMQYDYSFDVPMSGVPMRTYTVNNKYDGSCMAVEIATLASPYHEIIMRAWAGDMECHLEDPWNDNGEVAVVVAATRSPIPGGLAVFFAAAYSMRIAMFYGVTISTGNEDVFYGVKRIGSGDDDHEYDVEDDILDVEAEIVD